MSKMNIYITRQLSFATIFIAIVLTVAVWLTQSLRFVDIVVNKGLDISTFFYLVSLLIPDLLSIVLPAALLMATLFVYNKLIAENELIVMKAIGMSPLQILKPALQVTAFVMLILYAINLYILPLSFRKLRDLEHDIRNRMSISMLQSGQFNNFKDLTIYIRKISSDGDVSGIIIHNSQDEKKPYTITARKGAVIKKEKETRLVLIDGIRHEYPQNKGSILYKPKKISKAISVLFSRMQPWYIAIVSASLYFTIEYLSENEGRSFLALKGISSNNAGYIITIAWIGYAIGCPLLGFLSDFFERRKSILTFCSILAVSSIIMILYLPSELYIQVAFFILGFSASGQTIGFVTIAEQFKKQYVGVGFGLNNAMITTLSAINAPIYH